MNLSKLVLSVVVAFTSFSAVAHDESHNVSERTSAACTLGFAGKSISKVISVSGPGLTYAIDGSYSFDGSVWQENDAYTVGLYVYLNANPHYGSYKEVTNVEFPFQVTLYSDETRKNYRLSCK